MNEKVILVVDDEAININTVSSILAEHYQIRIATNGIDALEIIKNEKIDLVLLDVIMPNMNGYEVASHILENHKSKDIPFIFLTALTDPIHIRNGFEKGAVDYISKPFSKEELLARVLTHLRLNNLQKTLSETVEDLQEQVVKVEDSKKEFEAIFNYSKDCIVILDENLNFLNFNNSYLEVTNFSTAELKKKNYLDFILPEDRERFIDIFKIARKKNYIENIERTCITKTKSRVNLNISISLLPDKKRFLLLAKDVTSLKSLEEHARIASMGEMLGNIAHQWRQPLSIISTSASGVQLLKEYGDLDNETIDKHMSKIINETNYLSHVIDDFRNFLFSNEFEDVDIRSIIERTVKLIKGTLKSNSIELILNLNHNAVICCCPSEIIQSLINIINNAIDSLKENELNSTNKYIFISTEVNNDRTILDLKIQDTGGGIDTKVLSRIFEPYFTTKHKSRGTGIGLSSAYKNLRERHNCEICAYNEKIEFENKNFNGACFSIKFKIVNNI